MKATLDTGMPVTVLEMYPTYALVEDKWGVPKYFCLERIHPTDDPEFTSKHIREVLVSLLLIADRDNLDFNGLLSSAFDAYEAEIARREKSATLSNV